MSYKIPEKHFEDYATRFILTASCTPEDYHKRADLVKHFLNWSGQQFLKQPAPEQKPTQRPHQGIPTY